jgi:hypothetical protein
LFWPQTAILLISTSFLGEIADLSHRVPPPKIPPVLPTKAEFSGPNYLLKIPPLSTVTVEGTFKLYQLHTYLCCLWEFRVGICFAKLWKVLKELKLLHLQAMAGVCNEVS